MESKIRRGDWIQLAVVGASAPIYLFPRISWMGLLLVAPAVIFVGGWRKKRFFERTPLDWGIGLLLIQVLISTIAVGDAESGLPKIAGIVFGVLLYYSLVNVLRSASRIRWGLAAFVAGGTLATLIGLSGLTESRDVFLRTTWPELSESYPWIRWPIPGGENGFNPNALGGLIIIFLPAALSLLSFRESGSASGGAAKSRRVFSMLAYASLLLSTLILLITESLGSWLAFLIAIWLLFVSRRRKILSLAVVGVAVGTCLIALPTARTWAGRVLEEKVVARFPLWETGWRTMGRNPFFGIGLNQVRKLPSVGEAESHVHNQFLQTGAELGIPGLGAYLWVLAAAGTMYWRTYRKAAENWVRRAVRGLAAGQLALFFFGMTDCIPLGSKVGVFFWFSLALMTALNRHLGSRAIADLGRSR